MQLAHQFGILDYHLLEALPVSTFTDWLRFFKLVDGEAEETSSSEELSLIHI